MVSRTIEPVPTAQQYKDRSSTAEQGASTSPVGGSNPSGPAKGRSYNGEYTWLRTRKHGFDSCTSLH